MTDPDISPASDGQRLRASTPEPRPWPDPAQDASAPAETARSLDRLHPRAITLWRLGTFVRGAVFVAVAVVAEVVLRVPFPADLLAFTLAVITLVATILYPPARYRAWGYRLRDSDLYLRHGVLFRTTTIVPHARIQHVDTRHGPVDRFLGLAEVVVFTAGTRGAIITIPALNAATAESLRDRLAALSGAGDAV